MLHLFPRKTRPLPLPSLAQQHAAPRANVIVGSASDPTDPEPWTVHMNVGSVMVPWHMQDSNAYAVLIPRDLFGLWSYSWLHEYPQVQAVVLVLAGDEDDPDYDDDGYQVRQAEVALVANYDDFPRWAKR